MGGKGRAWWQSPPTTLSPAGSTGHRPSEQPPVRPTCLSLTFLSGWNRNRRPNTTSGRWGQHRTRPRPCPRGLGGALTDGQRHWGPRGSPRPTPHTVTSHSQSHQPVRLPRHPVDISAGPGAQGQVSERGLWQPRGWSFTIWFFQEGDAGVCDTEDLCVLLTPWVASEF